MKELKDILAALDEVKASGEPAAVATIVKVSGSTYRRPGARLLMTGSGRMVGSISGGCLEGDVFEKAKEVMATGAGQVMQYDMTADDDLVWGLGLGCNGTVDVWVERVPFAGPVDHEQVLREAAFAGQPVALATVFRVDGVPEVRPGDRLFLRADGSVQSGITHPELEAKLRRDAADLLDRGVSRTLTYAAAQGRAEAFIEILQPPLPLVVFGAGHDAIPVVHLAHDLGWYVTVVDSRPQYTTRERFPEADALILARPDEIGARVSLDRRTFVVVMTHNYNHDLKILRHVLSSPVRYIGMLGPRVRTERVLRDLREAGVSPSDEQRVRLFGPVGLDLGAESPEEIALAIAGEIQAVRTGRGAGFLRTRKGPIHDPVPSSPSHTAPR